MWWLAIIGVLLLICIYSACKQRKQIVRFYKPGCKYCVDSQQEWDSFKALAAAEKVDFDVVDVNLSSDNPLIYKYGIDSVPTVIKITTLGHTEYNGPRVATAYMAFANE